ncbi:MAG: hypothetical protein ACRELY_11315 [Polyangiaceae bacterium]
MKIWSWTIAVIVSATSGAFFLTQCGDSGDTSCPANPPTIGAACSLASGTICNDYPQPGCACCGGGGYQCTDGKWQETGGSGLAPGSAACPETVPDAGDPCSGYSPCGGAVLSCQYTCETGNGRELSAVCSEGAWEIEQTGEACLVDGGLDAGSDADLDANDAAD